MRLLLIGGGAREHALAWKLGKESVVEELICAPGNAGIEVATGRTVGKIGHVRCVPIDINDPAALLDLAAKESVDLTVVGPELPLSKGVADRFYDAGRQIFGPLQAAARLESSKAFAKEFMARYEIPTAAFHVCHSAEDAMGACRDFGFPVVIKADGLAAGKGVTVAEDKEAAEVAIREAMVEGRFGDAGLRLVVEECLIGTEVSFFVICDGHQGLAMPSAQDHKRVFDGDKGPNTGGMGAFAPSPFFPPTLANLVMTEIVTPALDGLRSEGTEYRGLLYVGLMLTTDGPKVIEFNVRFGDPEAQVVLPMVQADLAPVLLAAADGDLSGVNWKVCSDPHVGVVVASGGYPGSYDTGFVIDGLLEAGEVPGVMVFHAGSAMKDGVTVTSGGRVLTAVGRGATYREAIDVAYSAVAKISFPNKYHRTDIGHKALSGSIAMTSGHGE